MDIQRCFEILELDGGASPDDAKQAYKDIVNVWHPDRFSNNPRLRQKAEEKLKEVNIAYEMVKSFLSSNQEMDPRQKEATQAKAGAEYNKAQADAGARDKTEVAVEIGTRLFLNVCSYLYTTLHRFVVSRARKVEAEEKAKVEPGGLNQRQRQSRGKHRGGGKGRGKGIGKGRGRGKRGPQSNSGDF
jgi:curved DNA-binding protein CbpA